MAEISVIVPVYNVESYLSRCVDSILNQTFRDLELILIDDGSLDGSPAICDEYGRKDSRVRVIHQKNGGLSSARNAGLDWCAAHSDSRWITFVDSDDWLSRDALQVLLNGAKSLDTKISFCALYETHGKEPEISPAAKLPRLCSPREIYREQTVLMTVACAKLYERSCFQNVRFPVGKLHEDEFTTFRVIFSQEKLAQIEAPMYNYYVNSSSITRSAWSPRRLDVWEAFEEQIRFFSQRKDQEMEDFCLHRYLLNARNQLAQIEEHPDGQVRKQYVPLADQRCRSLLKQAKRRGCLEFEKDFAVLQRFEPVRTQLKLYWYAGLKRLKGKKNA